jgi:hypothetical protein
MSPVFPTVGNFPLTGVADLPNVTVAFPGEHWSNRVASGAIVPGEAVVPVSLGGKLAMKRAATADPPDRMAIATRVIEPPDRAGDSLYSTSLGPNEIVNRQIAHGEYVHAYYSGAFHLTHAAGVGAGGPRRLGRGGSAPDRQARHRRVDSGRLDRGRAVRGHGVPAVLVQRPGRRPHRPQPAEPVLDPKE